LSNEFFVVSLEKHDTKDIRDKRVNGSLTVIWRDWDKSLDIVPKMIYVSSVNSGEIKGPHIHKKRTSFFTCIHGKVVFIIREKTGKYSEIIVDANNPMLICVPKNIASSHVNLSNEISRVLTIADIAWKPNDAEMENVTFDDYNWSQWTKNTDFL